MGLATRLALIATTGIFLLGASTCALGIATNHYSSSYDISEAAYNIAMMAAPLAFCASVLFIPAAACALIGGILRKENGRGDEQEERSQN